MNLYPLCLVVAMILSGGSSSQSPLKASNASRHLKSVHHIRQVNFQNFTYRADDEFLHVTGGRGVYKGLGEKAFSFKVQQVKAVYGDVTEDGKDDAAVTIYYTGGGTGAYSKGFVFTMRRGRLALLATFNGGDRADGGIREVKVKGGLLYVQREEPERIKDIAVGLCCPLYLITTKYRWDGERLVQFGEAEKVAVTDEPGFI